MSLGDEHEASGGYGGSGQTRTRLPGTSGDPYGTGPRRPTRSSSRSLVTVVGVIVLLIAAIAFANRGGDDSAPPEENNAAGPQPAPTAASGDQPVQTTSNGIPTGYTQNQEGAQSAAANYSVALGSAEMFNKARRQEIVNTVYAPDVAAARQTDLDRAYSSEEFLSNIGLDKNGAAPRGQTFVSRVVPVGTKITSFNTDKATVEVWYTSLFGLSGENSTNPVSESWYTTTYQLNWTNDDWKVTD
ncbi:MAG: hypothetical protein H5T76_15185, partial [Streptomyces sp.]|nr:hypothetical protein [Streptomyces sp.]